MKHLWCKFSHFQLKGHIELCRKETFQMQDLWYIFFFKKEIRIRLLKQFMQERRFSNVRFVIFFKKEMCVGIFKQFMKERSHFKWNMRDTCFPLRGVLIRLTQSVHKGTMSFKCNHCYVGFFRRGNLNTKLP